MPNTDNIKRLNDIVDGASKLPVENQEYVLATMKGMLFTRRLLKKQNESTEMESSRENKSEI